MVNMAEVLLTGPLNPFLFVTQDHGTLTHLLTGPSNLNPELFSFLFRKNMGH